MKRRFLGCYHLSQPKVVSTGRWVFTGNTFFNPAGPRVKLKECLPGYYVLAFVPGRFTIGFSHITARMFRRTLLSTAHVG